MQTLDLCRGEQLRAAPGPAAVEVITEAWAGHTSGYLARLETDDAHGSPLYDLRRAVFVRPLNDRRTAWGNGRRYYWITEPGVYEAESRWHRGSVRRHWFAVEEADDGVRLVVLASRDEALARLWAFPGGAEELRAARVRTWEQRGSRRGWQRRVASAWAEAEQAGLPPLEGTPGQVDYAEVVRCQRLAEARRRLPASELAVLAQVREATWWIERRRRQLRRLVAEARSQRRIQA